MKIFLIGLKPYLVFFSKIFYSYPKQYINDIITSCVNNENFKVLDWIVLVLVSIVLVIFFGLVIVVIFQFLRKYIRFRKREIEKDELVDEIAVLNNRVFDLVEEKNKILALRINQIGGTEAYARQADMERGTSSLKGKRPALQSDSRFVKLTQVDKDYEISSEFTVMQSSDMVNLPELIDRFIKYSASQLHLYYTKEIIGYSVGESLSTKYPLEALNMALCRIEEKNVIPIHHSDRGVQYASNEYIKLLREYGIVPSMTECGNPKDNAVAERVNNTLKNELFMGLSFVSLHEVKEALERAVYFYNNLRPHGSIGMLTPKEAAKQKGDLKKNWTSYREKYIKSL